MVLSSANSGKYLMRSWQEKRAQALADRSRFTTEELSWLEVGADEGVISPSDDRVFVVSTQPIDPLTRPSKIDIRDAEHRR
jgi:hypothetical protein